MSVLPIRTLEILGYAGIYEHGTIQHSKKSELWGEIHHGLVKRIGKIGTSYSANIMSMLVWTYLQTGMVQL